MQMTPATTLKATGTNHPRGAIDHRSFVSRNFRGARTVREANTRNHTSLCPLKAETEAASTKNTSNDGHGVRRPNWTTVRENSASMDQSTSERNCGACISCTKSQKPVCPAYMTTTEYRRAWYGVTSVASAHKAVRPISFFDCCDPHAITG